MAEPVKAAGGAAFENKTQQPEKQLTDTDGDASAPGMPCDITRKLFQACSSLSEQQLVKPESFTLGDAMSAVNMLDPKMDVGMLHRFRRLTSFDQAVNSGCIKLSNFSQIELIKIMDRSIAMLILWLRGEPPQLTILSNVYLQDIDRIEDRILSGFLHLYVNVAHACRRVLLAANAFDNEDFQPHVLNAGLKPPNFLQNMNNRMRSFWDANVSEFDCDPSDNANQTRSADSVISSAMEAAFANLRRVDKQNSAAESRVIVNQKRQSLKKNAEDNLSLDDEYTLANAIMARLRVLEYWHQGMLLRHLTGDPGFDVSSPFDYLRLCESLTCSLEVIAESVAIISRVDEAHRKNMPVKNDDLFTDLNADDDAKENKAPVASTPTSLPAGDQTLKSDADFKDRERLVRCLQHGQSFLGFDYLLNLECMDYPRLTFPDLSTHAAYRYIEQTFLHLYYCTRQLVVPYSNNDTSRLSMDSVLEVLQRLTTDGSTQLIDPYAALDSAKIHSGRSHTAMHGKELSAAAAGDNNDQRFFSESENDDEDDLESKPAWRGVGDTVFGAFNMYNNEQHEWNADDDSKSTTVTSSVRPGYHDNLYVTEMRPNILVRSVLVLQTVAIATRFSSAPDQQASWYACARDTLMCFCMAPALTERDPFVCNEWSYMPFPRGLKMSIWKFLGVYFDNNSNDYNEYSVHEVAAVREEYELLLQPLIDGASNIIKERIRIFGMNKAVQREACLRLVNEIAIYEERARGVDARFGELFDQIADVLHRRLVARPLPALSASSSNSSGGSAAGGRSKQQQQQKAAIMQHTSASANRPSNEQIQTLRRTFEYFQSNTLSSWFAYHLSDVLAQAFTLSLELGLFSSGNGVTDTRVQELEYIYWYQAQHVFRNKLVALTQARSALHHNQQVYRVSVQSFLSRQATTNYAKIAAVLPPPVGLATTTPSARVANSVPQQQQASIAPQPKGKQSKSVGNKKAGAVVRNGNVQNNNSSAATNERALKAAAELAVRTEHRVLATFAQRKLIDAEKCASMGANFLDRQLMQARVVAHVCTAFTFTIRLLRLMNKLDGDTFEIPSSSSSGEAKQRTTNADKIIRLDVEELSFYHRLYPYNLAHEMRPLYFCSYDDFKNDAVKLVPLLLNFSSRDNDDDDNNDDERTAGDNNRIKSASAKTGQNDDSDTVKPIAVVDDRQQINYFLSTLPNMFDRIVMDLNEFIIVVTPTAASQNLAESASSAQKDPAVVATSPSRPQSKSRDSNVKPISVARPASPRDDIVWLYSDALRQTLIKVCRCNREALSALANMSGSVCATTRVTLDFTECSVFPVIRLS